MPNYEDFKRYGELSQQKNDDEPAPAASADQDQKPSLLEKLLKPLKTKK